MLVDGQHIHNLRCHRKFTRHGHQADAVQCWGFLTQQQHQLLQFVVKGGLEIAMKCNAEQTTIVSRWQAVQQREQFTKLCVIVNVHTNVTQQMQLCLQRLAGFNPSSG